MFNKPLNPLVLALAVGFLGCGSRSRDAEVRPPALQVQPVQPSTQESKTVKIRLKVGDQELPATLLDNATARDFAAQLPLTLSMQDLFQREKFASLPRALSEAGPRSDAYEVGQIGYWSPGPDVAVFYRQDGAKIPQPGIILIGTIDRGIESFNVSGSVRVTIELADSKPQ